MEERYPKWGLEKNEDYQTLKEDYENEFGKWKGSTAKDIYEDIEIDKNGRYTYKEGEYEMIFSDINGIYQINSSHPYDLTDYSYALSETDDITGKWNVYDPESQTYRITDKGAIKQKLVGTFKGMDKALKKMKEIDKKKRPRIDRT